MRASELRGGQISTIELKPVSGAFDPRPGREEEVELIRAGDEIVLRWRTYMWPVESATLPGRTAIADVLDSAMSRVCWVAQASADRASVQVHRFPGELRLPEPIEIGLDERIVEDLRKNFGVGGAVTEVAAWLDEQVLLGAAPLRRAVVAPGKGGQLEAFRMIGRRVSVDVRREKDRLRVERVTRGGAPVRLTVTLLVAPMAFCDATVAAEVASGARHALEEAVRSQDSYLRVWVEYNRLETDAILRRARAFGALPYSQRTRRPRDGGWTFRIGEVPDLDRRLRVLGDSDRFELEAARQAPDFETLDTPSEEEALSAPLLDFDLRARTLDLAAAEEGDEQPHPPERGYLFLSTRGDRTRLRRREVAEEQLRTGRCPMPWLGLLLEGRPSPSPRRREREGMSRTVRAAFGGRPTARQEEALHVALNTPDIALIQGPPGTGKTKVISALLRRIVELADEGVEVSHRILVTSAQHDAVENVAERSEVFGLPAVKVGSRRGDDGAGVDGVERFRADRMEALRATLKDPPDAERVARGRRAAVAILRAPLPASETTRHLHELLEAVGDLVTPGTADRLRQRVRALARPASDGVDPELAKQRLDAARGMSFLPGAFLDGGPIRARKALLRLDDVLSPAERALLTECANWADEDAAPSCLPKV
jgi:hypothetical protein